MGTLDRKTFPAGHILMRQGESGEHAWLIEEGKLEVVLFHPETGKPKRLNVIGHGAIIGEMALIDHGRRSASVRTLSEVTAIEFSRTTFERMISQCTPLGNYLLKSLIGAIRAVYGLPIPPLEAAELANIRSINDSSHILERRMYPCDHVFFNDGDPPTAAYLIQRGTVSIRKGDTELVRLGPGRIFGELALMSTGSRNATAVAIDPTGCELIKRRDFDTALASMPPILRAMTKLYIDQLSNRA